MKSKPFQNGMNLTNSFAMVSIKDSSYIFLVTYDILQRDQPCDLLNKIIINKI